MLGTYGRYYQSYRGVRNAGATVVEATARGIRRGAIVEVWKGRKVAKGTVGEVFWIGDTQFGTRIGLKDEAGDIHWTAASNVRELCQDCA